MWSIIRPRALPEPQARSSAAYSQCHALKWLWSWDTAAHAPLHVQRYNSVFKTFKNDVATILRNRWTDPCVDQLANLFDDRIVIVTARIGAICRIFFNAGGDRTGNAP